MIRAKNLYSRLDSGLSEHRKVLEAADLIGSPDGLARVLGLWMITNNYCTRRLTDGFVPHRVVADAGIVDSEKVAAIFVQVGVYELAPGGFLFHDWKDYNPTKEKITKRREWEAKRKDRQRHPEKYRIVPGGTDAGPEVGLPQDTTTDSGTRPTTSKDEAKPKDSETLGNSTKDGDLSQVGQVVGQGRDKRRKINPLQEQDQAPNEPRSRSVGTPHIEKKHARERETSTAADRGHEQHAAEHRVPSLPLKNGRNGHAPVTVDAGRFKRALVVQWLPYWSEHHATVSVAELSASVKDAAARRCHELNAVGFDYAGAAQLAVTEILAAVTRESRRRPH